jgi:RNA polymerase sigma-70 factor (ECF subfamily)
MHSDDAYITGVQRGDEALFTALVREHLPSLTRFAFGFTGVEDEAHDVVQEVFARVWQLGADWAPGGSVAAYLFTAVRYRALNRIKTGRASQRLRDAVLAETDHASHRSDPYPDVALVARVRRELRTLTERQRDALRLRYEHGHTMPQVARVLGVDVTAAEKLVARGLAALRTKLAQVRQELE